MLVRICLLRLYCTDLNYGVIKRGFDVFLVASVTPINDPDPRVTARRIKHLQ